MHSLGRISIIDLGSSEVAEAAAHSETAIDKPPAQAGEAAEISARSEQATDELQAQSEEGAV